MSKERFVVKLQALLAESGYNPGLQDGVYGDLTEAAFRQAIAATDAESDVCYIKPARSVHSVFIHCSAADSPEHDDISVIRAWHLERGWNDVGYHYFITKNGTVQQGRATELTPAAQRGHNKGSIAICLHGKRAEGFTEAQFAALRRLCKDINEAHCGGVIFRGHCEVSAKACPVFDYRKVLQLTQGGRLGI